MADKKIPVALLDGSCVWVDTKDAAALAGMAKLPFGEKEFAGALYESPEGKFCYSQAVPGTRDDFVFATDPKAGKFAGMFHTHHGDQETEFSPEDIRTAEGLNRTSYIRGNASGEVRRFEPGVDRPIQSGRVRDSVQRGAKAPGTLVGVQTRREALAAAYDLHNPPTKP